MRPEHPKPVTDGEVRRALALLKTYPSGLTRADLGRHFSSDRFGRDVMAALNEQGIAAVITVDDPYGSGKVYRLARDISEVNDAADTLASYERSLRRRREGMYRAWAGGNRPRQADMFEQAPT